jgi:hypothetical protein
MTGSSLLHAQALARRAAAACLSIAALVAPAVQADAQVRITEALVNPLGSDAGQQVVEITNFGSGTVSISSWRLVSPNAIAVLPAGRTLAAGTRYQIHLTADGTNDPLHYYTGSGFAPVSAAANSLALYAASGSIGDPSAMRDFVQWGAASQAGEQTAASASLWISGEFVPITSEGNSMQLCEASGTGATAWIEAGPTLGAPNDCSSQSQGSTWGRLKSFYR